MVFSDARAALTTNLMWIWSQSTAGANGTQDFSTEDIKTAQLITGTFTADATTQDFYLRENTNFGNFDGYIGAIQLRDVTAVPEPSTYGLLAAGTCAASAIIRRRRKQP